MCIEEHLLLNGSPFPSTIYVPLDKSYSLECHWKKDVYWKLYLTNGTIQIIKEKLIRLKEFDRNRDGLYQCHSADHSEQIFIFSNGDLLSIFPAFVFIFLFSF